MMENASKISYVWNTALIIQIQNTVMYILYNTVNHDNTAFGTVTDVLKKSY